ncbi:MAG: hypothetical protein IKB61_00630 [Elusimicrobiaceae bacterium]|nr:hypothetical protein [Elusimicrobiaceae bacterium]
MKINKIFDGESVQFELTELLPVQYEAIMCGLELLDEKQEGKNACAASGMLLGFEAFERANPKTKKGEK